MFYLMTYSTPFNYSYMMLDMIMDKLKIVTEKTHCHHFIGYSSGFTAKVFYIHHSTDRQCLYCTTCGILAGMRNCSMGPP